MPINFDNFPQETIKEYKNKGQPQPLSQNQGTAPPQQSLNLAKNFYWVSEDNSENQEINQQIIGAFAQNLGAAADAFMVKDYPAAQRFIIEASALSGRLQEMDGQKAALNYKAFRDFLRKNDPYGLQIIDNQDLQNAPPPNPQSNPQAQSQQNLPALAQPKAKPAWKNSLGTIPVLGGFVDKLPDQNSAYDAALNMALGEGWANYKPIVTLGLLGGGAYAAYQYVVKPMMAKPQFIEPEPMKNPKKKPRKPRKPRKMKNSTCSNQQETEGDNKYE